MNVKSRFRAWFRRWWSRGSTEAVAAYDREQLRLQFLDVVSQLGRPRGLKWLSVVPNGEPVFARDGKRLIAILPLIATFEPLPDAGLEDVPQAREPRPIHALFHFANGWQTDGRAIFNLSAEQIVTQAGWEEVDRGR